MSNSITLEAYKNSFQKIPFNSKENILKYLSLVYNLEELSDEFISDNYPIDPNAGVLISKEGGEISYYDNGDTTEYDLVILTDQWIDTNLDVQIKRLYDYFRTESWT